MIPLVTLFSALLSVIMADEKESDVHEIILEADAELRFEVESKSDTITLEVNMANDQKIPHFM